MWTPAGFARRHSPWASAETAASPHPAASGPPPHPLRRHHSLRCHPTWLLPCSKRCKAVADAANPDSRRPDCTPHAPSGSAFELPASGLFALAVKAASVVTPQSQDGCRATRIGAAPQLTLAHSDGRSPTIPARRLTILLRT